MLLFMDLKKNKNIILLGIVIIGFLFRLYFFQTYPYISFDGTEYARLGKNLIERGVYAFGSNNLDNTGVIFPSGYPIFIGLMNLFFQDLFISGTVVSMLAGILSIYLIYLVAKELFGLEAGLFAAFSLAVCPPIADFSAKIMAESLFIFFILSAFLLFIKNIKSQSNFKSIFLGIAIGFIFLTKPEGAPFILLPLLYFYFARKNGKENLKKIIAGSLLSMIFLFAVISPYLIFLKNKTGEFAFSGKGGVNIATGEFLQGREYQDVPGSEYFQTFRALDDENLEMGINKDFSQSFAQSIKKDSLGFLNRYIKNLYIGFYDLGIYILPSLLILPIIFAFKDRKTYKRPEILAFSAISIIIFLILPLYQVRQRYLFAVIVFLIIFASSGYIVLQNTLKNLFCDNKKHFCRFFSKDSLEFISKNIKALMIAAPLIIIFFPLVKDIHPVFIEHKKAGEFIKNNISGEYEKLNIMAIKSTVCFYANSSCTGLPYAELDKIIEYSKKKKVDYIVIDERYTGFYPNYSELINLDKFRNGYKLVYENKIPAVIRVFEVAQ